MKDCEFCRAVTGERAVHVLCENESAVAFLDRNPAARGHTLVVPRAHHECLFTGDEPTVGAVFRTVQQVIGGMNRTLDPDGVSLFYTSGEIVGRVTHAHVHLLPRYADDQVHVALERGRLDDDDAERLAARLRSECPMPASE
jgi:histidine triad (HIT) family protein